MLKKLNKIIAIILVIAMMGSYVYADDSVNGDVTVYAWQYADVNKDNVVDAEDALEILKHASHCIFDFVTSSGVTQPKYIGEFKLGDPSGNGIIDAEDALLILKYAARLIDKFPIEDLLNNNEDPQPTEEPYNYMNSFIAEVESSESKVFTAEDFPETGIKEIITRGKLPVEAGYRYELVMVVDDVAGNENALQYAMAKTEAFENVISVSYNEYLEHENILSLNYDEYVLEVGESIDLSIADYRPYKESFGNYGIIFRISENAMNVIDYYWDIWVEHGAIELFFWDDLVQPEEEWFDFEINSETDYLLEIDRNGNNEVTYTNFANLLSTIPEVELIYIARDETKPSLTPYERWEFGDGKIATMTLSGGEDIEWSTDKINQTATITARAPGEMTVSVTKGVWGDKGVTATCKISVVELSSETYNAEYPSTVQYVDAGTDYDAYNKWSWDESGRVGKYGAHRAALNGFYSQTITEALSDSDGENVVFSPLNVYMALSLIAETTDGNSRKQILDLIGVDSIEALRKQSNAVWNSQYCDDGTVTTILANSVWLRNDTKYNGALLKTLADNYYASSFSGEMGSAEYDAKLRDWLNTQTGNLLGDKVSEISTNPENVLMLASTVYYRGKWAGKYSKNATEENTFYTADGEVTTSFMNKNKAKKYYYWGEKFGAVAENIEEGGQMWFILPDEGVSVDDLLKETELMDFVLHNDTWENKKEYKINLSVPKFDIDSDIAVEKMLKNLGVTDIFSSSTASFAPLMANAGGIYVSEIKHSGRVIIDEEGCTATSFIVTTFPGDAPPQEKEVIDFKLNRPFIYILTSDSGAPLYVGIVNNPT